VSTRHGGGKPVKAGLHEIPLSRVGGAEPRCLHTHVPIFPLEKDHGFITPFEKHPVSDIMDYVNIQLEKINHPFIYPYVI
jgi:hypothetical protein